MAELAGARKALILRKVPKTIFLLSSLFYLSSLCATADSFSSSLYSPLAASGSTITSIELSGLTSPSQATITGSGYAISFTGVGNEQGIVKGTIPNEHATPVAGLNGSTSEYLTGGYGSALTSSLANSGNYLSTGIGSITIAFDVAQSSLALLWGSIDSGNSLSFNDGSSYVLTGKEIETANRGSVDGGFRGPGGSAYVVVDTTTPFTSVIASSNFTSFEFSGIAAANSDFSITAEPRGIKLTGVGAGLLAFLLWVNRNFRSNRLRLRPANLLPPVHACEEHC